jgi:hypothetical protein
MSTIVLAERNHDNGQYDEASVRIERRGNKIWLRENDGCNVAEYKLEDTGIDLPQDGEDLAEWAERAIRLAAAGMVPDDLTGAERMEDMCAWALDVQEVDRDDTNLPDNTQVCIVGKTEYYGPYSTWRAIREWEDAEIAADGTMELSTAKRIIADIAADHSITELSHNQAAGTHFIVVVAE